MKCKLPFTDMSIMRNGKVRVCCYNTKILGDLNKQSIGDIWNGEEYQKLRELISKDDFSYGCEGNGCPIAG